MFRKNKSNDEVIRTANQLATKCLRFKNQVSLCAEMVYTRNICQGLYFSFGHYTEATKEINISKKNLEKAIDNYDAARKECQIYCETHQLESFADYYQETPHDVVANSIRKFLKNS